MTMPRDKPNLDPPPEVERAGYAVIGCAIEAHRRPGPGPLESLDEGALCHELGRAGLPFERQPEIAVPYRQIVPRGRRLDLAEPRVGVVGVRPVAKPRDVHGAPLLSCLRATGLPLGLLVNLPWLREGIRRVCAERSSALTRPPHPTPPSPSSPLS
ncbi:MAG: GxxExxY protein [Phycisphaerae bacterium]|nr:GxxExxY protein [Phycisphaerae bacterium]